MDSSRPERVRELLATESTADRPELTRIDDRSVRVWRTVLEIHAELIGELGDRFRKEHQLSVSDFDVLINIHPDERVRHKELAGRVILTRTALTRLLDRLCLRGWVSREAAPEDHRGVLVALTDEGRRVRREAARTNSAAVRAYFAALDPAELADLERLTTRLACQDNGNRHEGAH